MTKKKTLLPEENAQVISTVFNHLVVENMASFAVELEFIHNELVNPVLIIRDGKEDKPIEDIAKKYEGKEI